MNSGSLRLRLFVAAAISITLALGLAGFGLGLLFERYVERRVEQELHSHLIQLAAGIAVRADGRIVVNRELADPRFSQPLSGLYWQIDADGKEVARSRSLWDEHLTVPTPPANPEDVHIHLLPGPGGIELFSQERLASVKVNGKDRPLVLTVGLDRREITETVAAFSRDLIAFLMVLGAALALGAWLQVSIGLRPLELIRGRLEAVRSGAAKRLEDGFPVEVQPLADEVNGLLGSQEQQLVKARRRAGNLAHGLKTPITILGSIARDLRRAGADRPADDLEEQASALGLHVERELARARIATGHGKAQAALKPVLDRVIAAVKRLPREASLTWDCSCAEPATVPMDGTDLTELLGNILDNAGKWAKSRVSISTRGDAELTLIVEDDGPGVPPDKLMQLTEPGRRLDESAQGSGLGLAIASDIAEAYGLRLTFGKSPLGGLAVTIWFPPVAARMMTTDPASVAFRREPDYKPAHS
jgi:signal transduction histidine kinase